MSKQTETTGKPPSDKQLTAARKLVETLGSLEKAKQAIEELTRLRKVA